MPHRATYIFPRQFAERGFDESAKQKLDHEKKRIVNSIKSPDTFGVESDVPKKPFVSATAATTTAVTPDAKDDFVFPSGKHSAVSDVFAGGDRFRIKSKQIAAFYEWLTDKKRDRNRSDHRRRRGAAAEKEDRELLLPPAQETVKVASGGVDRSFDREVSLPRLSSGSSYAGSLFSGTTTTFDGTATFSSDINTKDDTSSYRVSTTRRHEEEEEEQDRSNNNEFYARKYKESYCLQVTLAKRLTCLASLTAEPTLNTGTETWDAEAVSYRLWVNDTSLHSARSKSFFFFFGSTECVLCFSGEWVLVVHGQDIGRFLQHTGDEPVPVGDVQ